MTAFWILYAYVALIVAVTYLMDKDRGNAKLWVVAIVSILWAITLPAVIIVLHLKPYFKNQQ